ncbi:MAG: peptidase domain-containing ABC transporter [Vicinamibacterales bacterium]
MAVLFSPGSVSDEGVLGELPILRFLPESTRSLVVRRFTPCSFAFGGVIAAEGTPTDALYVLVSGRARVVKRSESGEDVPLNVLRAGDSFGEVELLESAPRPHSVRASTDVLALRLDATEFRSLVDQHPDIRTYLELQLKHARLAGFFKGFPAFARLPPAAVVGVVLAELEPVTVEAGHTIYTEGDPAGPLFLIQDGRVRSWQSEGGRPARIMNLGAGEYFGEVSAIKGTPRGATVEATTRVRLLTLSGDSIARLSASLPEFKTRLDERIAQYDYLTTAEVPADITEELLPAAATTQEAVSAAQTDRGEDDLDSAADAPFAEDGHFVKGRERRVPIIRQIDEMDCGAASLAMVSRALGRRVSLARIRQLVNTGLDGTSLRSLCRAGEELGLATRAVKASARHLEKMPVPAIVHWDEYHWIVLTKVRKNHVYVADPAAGHRRFTRAEFLEKWSGYAALFDYTPAFEQAPESTRLLDWMAPLIKPHRGVLLQALGLAVVVSVMQMVLPVFTQVIVDRVLVEQDTGLLKLLIAGMGVTMVFIVASLLAQRYLLSWSAVRIDAASLDLPTRRLLSLPMSYFATRRTGDLQRRLEGVRLVRDFLVQHGIAGITGVAQLAATVALMTVYSPWLTLVFLATAPLYGALMVAATKLLRPTFVDLEEQFSKYHSYQIDAIKGIETVKALGGESAFRRLLLEQFLQVAGKIFRADYFALSYEGAIEAVTFLGVGLFLWAGAYEVLDGTLSIGGLVAFNSLVALATVPIRNLLSLWDNLQRCEVMLNRLDDVFQHEPEQGNDRSVLRPVKSLVGQVSLRNVGFRYGGPEAPPILSGLTVDVPAGKTVAIVGRSGSGKTTLAKCLSGLLEPTDGTILFDGLDQKTLNYRDLRRQIGFVLQDSYVFTDSIARNIAFGEYEPDMERVLWAAEVASAHEFIARLPFGYDTKIGETGLAISGGQRQRIAIARAIYNKPPILIFDEATSSLDTESERAVQQNIDSLLEGRTAFVIAHRLSTVRNADVILVLERGKLVEQGSHDELMKRRGLYYYLASQQLGVAG